MISEKKDDELFVVDKIGQKNLPKELKLRKLKADEILTPHSSFYIPRTRSLPTTKKAVKIAKSTPSYPQKKLKPERTLDIWEAPIPSTKPTKKSVCESEDSYLVPHPGQSYNPSSEDHEILLQKVESIQNEIIEKRIKDTKPRCKISKNALFKKTDTMIAKANKALLNPSAEQEDTIEEIVQEETEPVDQENIPKSGSALKSKKKKQKSSTLAKQNMQSTIKKASFKRENEDLANLKTLLQTIKSNKSQLKAAKKRKSFPQSIVPDSKAKKDGGSLRTLKPIGSLIRDRFTKVRHSNVLGMIQKTAESVKSKISKVKYCEKKSYKN